MHRGTYWYFVKLTLIIHYGISGMSWHSFFTAIVADVRYDVMYSLLLWFYPHPWVKTIRNEGNICLRSSTTTQTFVYGHKYRKNENFSTAWHDRNEILFLIWRWLSKHWIFYYFYEHLSIPIFDHHPIVIVFCCCN